MIIEILLIIVLFACIFFGAVFSMLALQTNSSNECVFYTIYFGIVGIIGGICLYKLLIE